VDTITGDGSDSVDVEFNDIQDESAAETPDGASAADIILGSGDEDILNGGAGGDLLSSDPGASTLVFEEGGGNDAVTDFNDVANLDLTSFGLSSFDDLNFEDDDSGAVLAFETSESITFEDVDVADLSADQFLLNV
jgi:hypothetical protein